MSHHDALIIAAILTVLAMISTRFTHTRTGFWTTVACVAVGWTLLLLPHANS